MSTSVSVNESPSLQDRTRTLGKGGARAAIGLLIAGFVLFSFVLFVVGTAYLTAVGLDLQDAPVIDLGG